MPHDWRWDQGRWNAKARRHWKSHAKVCWWIKYVVFSKKKKKKFPLAAVLIELSLEYSWGSHTLPSSCLSSITLSIRVPWSEEEQGLVSWLVCGPREWFVLPECWEIPGLYLLLGLDGEGLHQATSWWQGGAAVGSSSGDRGAVWGFFLRVTEKAWQS